MKSFLRPLIGALMLAGASLSASPGAAATRASDGYIQWLHVGASPLKSYQGGKYRVHAWIQGMRKAGYSEVQITEFTTKFNAGDFTTGSVTKGDAWKWQTWYSRGQIQMLKQVRLMAEGTFETINIRLSTGEVLTVVLNCDNIGELESPPEPPAPPPPPPAEEVVPPPVIAPPPVEQKQSGCDLDPKLVVGQEYEPTHNGNRAKSSFLSGALYCTWRGKNGTHGVGVGIQASAWDGLVNVGRGKFKGDMVAVGPAYEFISDNGWDIEGKLLFGKLNENFREGNYRSHRDFGLVGAAVSYNNYQRRLRGERWLPETQAFGFVGIPISTNAEHTWMGKPISDTRDLSRLGVLAQAGVRQWLYEGKVVSPYLQVGTFLETPGNWTGSARIGIADKNRICGVGVGIDVDFLKGGSAFGLGWWCDVVRGIKVLRASNRHKQIYNLNGAIDAGHGFMMVPLTRAPTDPSQTVGQPLAVGLLTSK
jgi:hypothetical protein